MTSYEQDEVMLAMRELRMAVIYRNPIKVKAHLDKLMALGGAALDSKCRAEADGIHQALESQEFIRIFKILARAECSLLRSD